MLLAILLVACDTTSASPDDTDASDAVGPVEVTDASFPCITDMRHVRGFYVDNLVGDLDATLTVANDPEGSAWPVGSLVQLVPFEAMVKREAGFSAATDDWEFFSLRTDASGTEILARGSDDVVNQFGGNCADCHRAAAGAWDWICEQDHGCVPLPLSAELIEGIQQGDARCGG